MESKVFFFCGSFGFLNSFLRCVCVCVWEFGYVFGCLLMTVDDFWTLCRLPLLEEMFNFYQD